MERMCRSNRHCSTKSSSPSSQCVDWFAVGQQTALFSVFLFMSTQVPPLTSCIICCSSYQCSLHLYLFPSTTPSSTVSSDWLPWFYFHFNLHCYFRLLSKKLLSYNYVFATNVVLFYSTPAYKITSSWLHSLLSTFQLRTLRIMASLIVFSLSDDIIWWKEEVKTLVPLRIKM